MGNFHRKPKFYDSETFIYPRTECLNSGWLQLKPLRAERQLKQLIFPINDSTKFAIGCSTDDDLILPPTFGVVPEVVLYIENHKIFIENVSCSESIGDRLKIDGEIFGAQRKLAIDLVKNAAISIDLQFGPPKYNFALTRCSIPNVEFYQNVTEIFRCVLCRKFWAEPTSMPCGHLLCQICFNRIISPSAPPNSPVNSPTSLSMEEITPASNIQNSFKCPKCSQKVSWISVNNYYDEIEDGPILSNIAEKSKLFYDWYYTATCSECDNSRCFTLSPDYWRCLSCNCYLCPLCALDLHRNHKMVFGYSEMHRTVRKFTKCVFAKLDCYIKLNTLSKRLFNKIAIGLALLKDCQNLIKESTAAIEDLTKTAKSIYSTISHLDIFAVDQDLRIEQIENLKLFQALFETLRDPVEFMLQDLNIKRSVINKIQSKIIVLPSDYVDGQLQFVVEPYIETEFGYIY